MLYPPQINYAKPESLDEAMALLNSHKNNLLIAGGTIGVLRLKKKIIKPDIVVDIGKLKELRGIEFEDRSYNIGSATRIYEITESDFNGASFSLLKAAASNVGDPLLRNMGTVGGNVCLGDPSNDLPPALLALDAELSIRSHNGTRKVKMSDFYISPFRTTLAKNEILFSINFAELDKGYRWFYYKHYIRHLDHSVINVAAVGKVKGGKVEDFRIAIGGEALRIPVRLETSWIMGKAAGQEELKGIINEAIEKCICTDDRQGSAAYKKRMIERIIQ
ncbi:MAG: FAD binding domain-containing protein, partial [Nitrososphaeria archaeon]